MAFTVKKLANLSGVSVRTLHFYDEIDLLKPAYVGEQGYRYYEDEQLLMLQQILFYRELGFELKKIQHILSQKDFDKVKALESHRKALCAQGERMSELIKTVDLTINKLKGSKHMKETEIFKGFSPEEQSAHEAYLVNRYGKPAKNAIAESKVNTKNWSSEQWQAALQTWNDVCQGMMEFMAKNEPLDSEATQLLVKKHYEGIKQIWTPDRNSYTGLGLSYMDLTYKKKFEKYDDQHPKLAKYLADAMKIYADRNLD